MAQFPSTTLCFLRSIINYIYKSLNILHILSLFLLLALNMKLTISSQKHIC